jgi:ABC-type nitrate/sulfonate/bicarbonate transport system permease component
VSTRREQRSRWASRAVQFGFLVALLALWYFGTTFWGINHLLLPNPVRVWAELKDVLASGDYLPDLQITLTELAAAFTISCTTGVTLGYVVSRSPYLIISFFPIVLNTIAGFGYVDRIFITAARSMGASDLQMFRLVLLPAALPVILTGLRIGFTVALLSILGSETIASLAGLGHRIVNLAEGMETERMFAYIAFAVAIAVILNTITSTIERRARH